MNLDHLGVYKHNPKAAEGLKLFPPDEEFKELWDWQQVAFPAVSGARFSLVTAFCGSGKSFLQVCLAIDEVIRSGYTQKQLIVVPQEHIHEGFSKDQELEYQSIVLQGKKYQWRIQDNFCNIIGLRVNKLVEWLLKSPAKLSKGYRERTISGLNAVATHAALVAAWKKMTLPQKRKAIKHLSLRGDECHHIKNVLLAEEEDFDFANGNGNTTGFGEVCTFLLNEGGPTTHLHLTTATFFRSDRSYVLSKDARSKFSEYHLPWEEHFKTLGIEDFHLQWQEYPTNGSPIPCILARIKAEPKHRHAVTVPSTGIKWREDGKEYLRLLKGLEKMFPGEVLDLITQSTQKKNKQKLLAEPKKLDKKNPPKFKVIVMCQLGREGTDWCPCDRLHNASGETALTLTIQTIGRPFRRYKGKTNIIAYNYVPKFISPKKGLSKRELISDRANALLVTMMTDELVNTMVCPPLKPYQKPDKPEGSDQPEGGRGLGSILGSQLSAVFEDMAKAIENLVPVERTKKHLREAAREICERYDIDTTQYNVIDAIIASVLRRLAPPEMRPSVSVSFLRKTHNFDKIMENATRSIYFGNINARDFKILRNILEGEEWNERYNELIEVLKEDNPEIKFPRLSA